MERTFAVVGMYQPINEHGEELEKPETIGEIMRTGEEGGVTDDHESALAALLQNLNQMNLKHILGDVTATQSLRGTIGTAHTVRTVFAATKNDWKSHEWFLYTAVYEKLETASDAEINKCVRLSRMAHAKFDILSKPKSVRLEMEDGEPKRAVVEWETEEETQYRLALLGMDENNATVN